MTPTPQSMFTRVLMRANAPANHKDPSFYLGKKVAYVYRAQKEVRGTKIRVIWGKVTRPHGKGDTGPFRLILRPLFDLTNH
jgi:ribosomal protein L35AE/L33A